MLLVREVAEQLRCSISNVHSLIESGALPTYCVGANGKGIRISGEDLQTFLDSRRQGKRRANLQPAAVRLKHLR